MYLLTNLSKPSTTNQSSEFVAKFSKPLLNIKRVIFRCSHFSCTYHSSTAQMCSNHITSTTASLASLITLSSVQYVVKISKCAHSPHFGADPGFSSKTGGSLSTSACVQHSPLPKLWVSSPCQITWQPVLWECLLSSMLHEPSAGRWPTWQSCCFAWPASFPHPLQCPSAPIQMPMSFFNLFTDPSQVLPVINNAHANSEHHRKRLGATHMCTK